MAAKVNGSSALVKEDEEPMDITVTHTELYQTLIDAGLPQKVVESLDKIFQTGKCKGGCSQYYLMAFHYISASSRALYQPKDSTLVSGHMI